MDPEEYWKKEFAKQEANPFNTNKIWTQTIKDVNAIRTDKHPKEMYSECLKNSGYWNLYAGNPLLSTDNMAMILCRDIGCEIVYCSLLKKSVPMEHTNSDCSNEIQNFNSCMLREKRKWEWGTNKGNISKYDYIQEQLKLKREEKKFKEAMGEDADKFRQDILLAQEQAKKVMETEEKLKQEKDDIVN